MPYSGRMIECDIMHSRRKGVWVHKRCLQLPWPVLQEKQFTDSLFADRDTFYMAPSTYVESLLWLAKLDTQKVNRKFTFLRDQKLRYSQWKVPVPFNECLQLYKLGSGLDVNIVISTPFLRAYIALQCEGRKGVKLLGSYIAEMPEQVGPII